MLIESTPLEPGEEDTKIYAPGVGLVQDEELMLIDYGMYIDPMLDEED